MATNERKLQTDNIRYLWHAIKSLKSNSANATKILKNLTSIGYKQDEAEQALENSIYDGILIAINSPTSNNSRNGKKAADAKIYRIPDLVEIHVDEFTHDWYCYECHSPGTLEHCSKCLRSYHVNCRRVNPEKGNDGNSQVSANPRRVGPIFDETNNSELYNTTEEIKQQSSNLNSNVESADSENIVRIIVLDEEEPVTEAQQQEEKEEFLTDEDLLDKKPDLIDAKDIKRSPGNNEIPELSNETMDIKPINNNEESEEFKDVVCIGQIRPPSRRRKDTPQSCKAEDTGSISTTEECDKVPLCTRCRLLEKSTIRDPPRMNMEETNYLLKFIFERVKSWLSSDTYSPLQFSNSLNMPTKKDLEIFEKLCLRVSISLDGMLQKLNNNKYTCLTEFKCDILDIQHCMGILYGINTAEYEATKYLVSDCDYELSEIRQCRDCYRHSNEKSSPFWFCKPCVPRHELVFAKQSGYSYWPAKVVRVKDNQYDVRFFGSQHSRAIIDANNVKPIDTELKQLKVKMTTSFMKAMEELQKHQILLQLPPGQFSFETERQNLIDLSMYNFETSFNSIMDESALGSGRKNKRSTKGSNKTPKQQKGGKRKLPLDLEISKPPPPKRKKSLSQINAAPPNIQEGGSSLPGKIDKANSSKKAGGTNNSKKPNSNNRKSKGKQNPNNTHGNNAINDAKHSNATELLKQKFSTMKNINAVQQLALETLESEISYWRERLTSQEQENNKNISKIKKKQWCYQCEEEAFYYCCWNTSYCSVECQEKHWIASHKKSCRRILLKK